MLQQFIGFADALRSQVRLSPIAIHEPQGRVRDGEFGVNLDGALLATQRAGRIMQAQEVHASTGCRGKILNISSGAAERGRPFLPAYGASKAALRHMTAIWAEEAKSEGISFLSLDPGDMDTPLHALAVPDADPTTLKRPDRAAIEIVTALLAALPNDAVRAVAEQP